MLKKYCLEFEEMHREIKNGARALEVISKRLPLFEDEGIGAIGIVNYLGQYVRQKEL